MNESASGWTRLLAVDLAAELPEGAVDLREAGRRSLRGVPGEWQLYAVGELPTTISSARG